MAETHITKQALASAMKELMADVPMEKITISDIVGRCQMTRQSFYYHFKDKYDLVNWIYYTEFVTEIQDSWEESGWELLRRTCQFFYDNRRFYQNALAVEGQNSFSEYFHEVIYPIILVQARDVFSDDVDCEFFATFFADAILLSIRKWLLSGAEIPPEQFVELMKNAVTGATRRTT